jgi:hypothetical protein
VRFQISGVPCSCARGAWPSAMRCTNKLSMPVTINHIPPCLLQLPRPTLTPAAAPSPPRSPRPQPLAHPQARYQAHTFIHHPYSMSADAQLLHKVRIVNRLLTQQQCVQQGTWHLLPRCVPTSQCLEQQLT